MLICALHSDKPTAMMNVLSFRPNRTYINAFLYATGMDQNITMDMYLHVYSNIYLPTYLQICLLLCRSKQKWCGWAGDGEDTKRQQFDRAEPGQFVPHWLQCMENTEKAIYCQSALAYSSVHLQEPFPGELIASLGPCSPKYSKWLGAHFLKKGCPC